MSPEFVTLFGPAWFVACTWWFIAWRVQQSAEHLARLNAETRRTRRRQALWDAKSYEWRMYGRRPHPWSAH